MTSTISTFNVLHDLDKWKECILQSQKRFSYTIDKILDSDSDIYCLNEISASLWPMLLKGLEKKYKYHTEPMFKETRICVCIFSKYPIIVLHQKQRLLIAYSNKVIIVATHLVAMEGKYQIRKHQINKIMSQRLPEIKNSNLNKDVRQAFENQNIFILGDLNMHLINETCMLYDSGLYDSWIQLEGQKLGYTWDPKQNQTIKWCLPYDNRRMRLDRILIKQKAKIKPLSISIDFNQKIPGCSILFPSDHFGLTLKYELSGQFYSTNHSAIVEKLKPKRGTGFRTIKTIKRYRILSAIAVVVMLVLLIKYLL